MRPPEQLERSTEDLTRLISAAPDLWKRVLDAQPGINAARYDQDQTTNGQGPADPTGRQATAERPDPAFILKGRYLTSVRLIAHHVNELYRLHATLATPVPGSSERAQAANEPGCHACHSIGVWSPPHTTNPTTVAGRLNEPQLLCQAHYEHTGRLDRLPDKDETLRWHETGRWPRTHEAVTN